MMMMVLKLGYGCHLGPLNQCGALLSFIIMGRGAMMRGKTVGKETDLFKEGIP